MSTEPHILHLPAHLRDRLKQEPGFQHTHYNVSAFYAWTRFTYHGSAYRFRVDAPVSMRTIIDLSRGNQPINHRGKPVKADNYGNYREANWYGYLKSDEIIDAVVRVVRGCYISWLSTEGMGQGQFCNGCDRQLMCLTQDIRGE